MNNVAKPTYYEMLRDPQWQRKRLEIMERDSFACLYCGDKTKTLNVHHTYYEKGLTPWEYPDHSLRTLCEPCHQKAQERMKALQREIGRLSSADLEVVIGFCRGRSALHDRDIEWPLESDGVIEGIVAPWFDNDGSIGVHEYANELESGDFTITGHQLGNAAAEMAESRRHDADLREWQIRQMYESVGSPSRVVEVGA
jgi:hypothetical protein